LIVVARHGSRIPSFQMTNASAFCYRLGRWRWPAAIVPLVLAGLMAGVPVGSLIWKSGLAGRPLSWQGDALRQGIENAFLADGGIVVQSLALALAAGGIAALLSLAICWTARGRFVLQAVYFLLLVLACTLPAPVVGFGLKDAILQMVQWDRNGWLARNLYYGPSLLPLLWAYVIRTLPLGVVILWPVFRKLPRELEEAAFLDGAGPLGELLRVKLPLVLRTLCILTAAVAAVSLNEVGTSKLVTTPGVQTFTLVLFDRMHYGIPPDVSCLGLVMLIMLFVFAGEFAVRKKGGG
jgi:ABC-type Fe3+ transport system permease subunit